MPFSWLNHTLQYSKMLQSLENEALQIEKKNNNLLISITEWFLQDSQHSETNRKPQNSCY